jgi:hypothetical protein
MRNVARGLLLLHLAAAAVTAAAQFPRVVEERPWGTIDPNLLSQGPPCSAFEGTSTDGWTAVNSTATIASAGGRKYVDVRDGSGASNFVAPASYGGNWFQLGGGCGSICFDISVIDDGLPPGATSRPYFVISDTKGRSATFQANPIAEGSGWRTVCAPVGPLIDGQLPMNGQGTWSYGANTSAASWGALLNNVQTFRIAVDFAGSSAAERLALDNICFRPVKCALPAPPPVIVDQVQNAPNVTTWKGCPAECTTVTKKAGTYHQCVWGRSGYPKSTPVQYVPGTRDEKNCFDPGAALDVIPRHRLFVHGIHSNRAAWHEWIERVRRQMDFLGYKTVADDTGKTTTWGDGSDTVASQVQQLAQQINTGFGDVPDGSVWVYAHSLGALKMEALLQNGYLEGLNCSWTANCASPLYRAAKKIGQVYIFQGAHGGCLAGLANGDGPYHPLKGACPASRDIAAAGAGEVDEKWNMQQIAWRGRGAQQKRITYVVATSDGGDICKGAAGFICDDDVANDGVVYWHQMTPRYLNVKSAVDEGLVIFQKEVFYCHTSGDTYEPPRLSSRLMQKYIGLEPGPFEYTVALPPPNNKKTFTLTDDQVTCDQQCFCIRNRAEACSSRIDCAQWEEVSRGPCIDYGSGGGTHLTTGEGFGFSIKEPNGAWTKCANENGICTVSGTRAVRYGANGKYATRLITKSTPCTNAVFGDPVPGVPKTCESQNDAVTAPPANRNRPNVN